MFKVNATDYFCLTNALHICVYDFTNKTLKLFVDIKYILVKYFFNVYPRPSRKNTMNNIVYIYLQNDVVQNMKLTHA